MKILAVTALSLCTLSVANAGSGITKSEVVDAQKSWGNAIVAIGKAYTDKGDYVAEAQKTLDTLYNYKNGTVLFKPTLAANKQFRETPKNALSYFVKGVEKEDHGFAIKPWSKVRFESAGIITDSDSAVAMGNYFFTVAGTDDEVKVEYTFGYVKDSKGNLRINVHHSSLPYSPAK
ncbi:MAG: hypothetical protein HF962_07955 [Sulfurovum sp.]|nr:hypothetical protein [Sulfurovum sp.]